MEKLLSWYIKLVSLSTLIGICQTANYGESCQPDGCIGVNQICSLTNNTCVCNAGYVENPNKNGCVAGTPLGQSCSASTQCLTINSECFGNPQTCQCQSGYFMTGSTCEKRTLGDTCSDTSQCSVTNSECNGGKCLCKSDYFTVGTSCLKRTLGDTCSDTSQCSVTNSECNGGKCLCKSDYFTVGTSCLKRSLGESCSDTSQCTGQNAVCYGTCQCPAGFYDNNGWSVIGGDCLPKNTLQSGCPPPSAYVPDTVTCLDLNARCSVFGSLYICQCISTYYDNKASTNRQCAPMAELQVISVQFTSIQTSQFIVSWSSPYNKGQYISGYKVQWRSKYDNSLAVNESQTLLPATTSYTLTGLTAGRAYTVTIVSEVNDNSLKTTFVVKEQAAKPNQVTRLDSSRQETDAIGGITVAWIAAEGVVDSYYVTLLDGNNQTTSANPVGSNTMIQFNTPQLKDGYNYTVQIQTRSEPFINQMNVQAFEPGESFRGVFKTLVKVPDPPTRLDCPDVSRKDQSIKLTWQAPANPKGDIIGYQVEMKDLNDQYIRSYNSTGTSVEYTATGLNPGTGYRFYVFTLNEQYKSSYSASNGICETSAPLPTPPRNVIVENVESRLFSISWEKPEIIYSAENLGYVINVQLENGTCVKEEAFKCSNCTKKVEEVYQVCLTNSSTMKTSSDLEGSQKYTISSLTPDTQYSVSVAAINYAGKGNTAEKTIRTKEEVPQKPKCSVSNIQTKSVTVTWTIGEPRPGQTTYTVMITGAYPAANQTGVVTGFTNRTMEVNQLEEFWNYSVVVKAATSLGFSLSDPCTTQTLPTAPEEVSDFVIYDAADGDAETVKLTWKAPTALKRNSIITEYIFEMLSTDTQTLLYNKTIPADSMDSYEYSEKVNVVPELTYIFQVCASNSISEKGKYVARTVTIKAGVPPNTLEEVDGVKIIDDIHDIYQTQFLLFVVKEFFMQNKSGAIRATGLIGCAKDRCSIDGTLSLKRFNSMRSWQMASNYGFPAYRITTDNWLKEAEAKTGRRRRSLTLVKYRVGDEDCSGTPDTSFCNGPLNPNTEYIIIAVACTSGGCLLSEHYGPFKTLPEIEDCTRNCSTTAIIIGVVMGVIILILASYAAFVTIRMSRLKPTKEHSNTNETKLESVRSPLYANESFSMPLHDIHPPSDSQGKTRSETEYARLDENTRNSKSTYEMLNTF